MKPILVPVDFTKTAKGAARYALHMAEHLKANLILCNAIYVPLEVPTAEFGSWPSYDLQTLKEESLKGLESIEQQMSDKLDNFSTAGTFQPNISCVAEPGGVAEVITKVAAEEKVSMLIMGMTAAAPATRLIFGSISRRMIDKSRHPLILVPEDYSFKGIKKIGFATSLADDDIEVIHAIASFARYFGADLLIAHVSEGKELDVKHQKKMNLFLQEVTSKINYNKIYFRHIEKEDVDKGLDWLSEHGLIDLFVMVHHKKGMLENLFSSHTHMRVNHLNVPLLIMPSGLHPVF